MRQRHFGVVLCSAVVLVAGVSTPVASAVPATHDGPLRFVATYRVPGDSPHPFGITIAAKIGVAYIADGDEMSLSVLHIGTGKVHTVGESALGVRIDGISVNPHNGRAFIPQDQASRVDVFQGAKQVATRTLPEFGSGAEQALYDAVNGLLYVTDQFLDAVHVFRRSKEIAVIPLQGRLGYGDAPGFGAVDSHNGHVLLAGDNGTLYVISGTSLRKIQTKVEGGWVAVDSQRGVAYTAGGQQDKVNITDLRTKTSRAVSVPSPTTISVDDHSGLAYVSTSSGEAYVLRGKKIVATFPESTGPNTNEPLAVDPSRDLAIIPAAHRLQIVHKSQIVEKLALPSKADTNAIAAFDPKTGDAVLTQQGAGTVSVLSPRAH